MAEVTTTQAAEILDTTSMTILRRVDDGLLPARREGLKKIAKIELTELRKFADTYGYRFNETIAQQYA